MVADDEETLVIPEAWAAHLDARPGGRLSLVRVRQVLDDPYAGDSREFGRIARDRRDAAYTLVAELGLDALPELEAMAPIGGWMDADEQRAAGEAMAVLPSDAAFDALLVRATQTLVATRGFDDTSGRNERYFGEALRSAMARFPRRALRLLAARAIGRGQSAERFASWLEPHVRRHRTLAREVVGELPEASRAVVEVVLRAADVPVAPDADVPAALRDPWGKKKPPKMPGFWDPSALPPPELHGGRGALSDTAVQRLGEVLAKSKVGALHPAVVATREACTPRSLARFAWALFEAWLRDGALPKDKWAFLQLGWLGDEEVAHRLVARLKEWPRQGAAKRAELGLEVLAQMPGDVALVLIDGLAQKASSKSLRKNAAKKIAAVAAERGLGAEELADRLVPTLGLDAEGSTWLDFGSRRFRVGFDAALRPFVRDEKGERRASLPKASKNDDVEKAAEAEARFKALKKSVRAVASIQLRRLEHAMARSRRWSADELRTLFALHPLLRHPVQALVWGAYDEAGLRRAFRVCEDGTFADVDDAVVELAPDAEVGLAHALELDDAERARWGERLADYELLEPFVQLGREVYRVTPERSRGAWIAEVTSGAVEATRVAGLESRGWMRGPVGDGGIWSDVERDGLRLRLDPGIPVYGLPDAPPQRLAIEALHGSLDRLSDVAFSELVRDLQSLRG